MPIGTYSTYGRGRRNNGCGDPDCVTCNPRRASQAARQDMRSRMVQLGTDPGFQGDIVNIPSIRTIRARDVEIATPRPRINTRPAQEYSRGLSFSEFNRGINSFYDEAVLKTTKIVEPPREPKTILKVKQTEKGFDVIAKKAKRYEVTLVTVETEKEARTLASFLRNQFNDPWRQMSRGGGFYSSYGGFI